MSSESPDTNEESRFQETWMIPAESPRKNTAPLMDIHSIAAIMDGEHVSVKYLDHGEYGHFKLRDGWWKAPIKPTKDNDLVTFETGTNPPPDTIAHTVTWQIARLDWNPSSSTSGRGYTPSDFETELDRHLPSGWTITEFESWSPKRTNHGGAAKFEVTIEHDRSPAFIELQPASTSTGTSGPTVYNSHSLTITDDLENRETVRDCVSMVHLKPPAEVFYSVVELARGFTPEINRQWF